MDPEPARHGKYRALGLGGFHNLHYTEWGDPRATPVVVCVHGYSGNARDFDFLAEALARGGARVICLDIAGRGESDWLSSPFEYHFAQFLHDIEELLAHLRVKEVDWVGTSMGGLLGLLLASRLKSPVRRLVMNDIGAFVPLDALQAIGRNLASPGRFASLEAVEAHMRRTHREWGDLDDAKWRHFAVHGSRRENDGMYRLHYDPQITRLLQPPPLVSGLFFWDAWYRVRCPVLLLRGETSQIFPASVAGTMIEAKPGTQLVEFAGCGHVPSLMVGEQIETVGNFLRAPATKTQWPRQTSSSSPGSSRTSTRGRSRSSTLPIVRPAS